MTDPKMSENLKTEFSILVTEWILITQLVPFFFFFCRNISMFVSHRLITLPSPESQAEEIEGKVVNMCLVSLQNVCSNTWPSKKIL